jgi:hypothetical protein
MCYWISRVTTSRSSRFRSRTIISSMPDSSIASTHSLSSRAEIVSCPKIPSGESVKGTRAAVGRLRSDITRCRILIISSFQIVATPSATRIAIFQLAGLTAAKWMGTSSFGGIVRMRRSSMCKTWTSKLKG